MDGITRVTNSNCVFPSIQAMESNSIKVPLCLIAQPDETPKNAVVPTVDTPLTPYSNVLVDCCKLGITMQALQTGVYYVNCKSLLQLIHSVQNGL